MAQEKYVSPEVLKKLYLEEKKSYREIAKELKHHPSLIFRKLKKYNIPFRKNAIWNKNKSKKNFPELKWGGNHTTGRVVWNKGLTKETDKRVLQQSKTYSKTHKDFSGAKNPFFNKRHTTKVKRHLSLVHGGTGIPREKTGYGPEFTDSLKEQIRFRDHYKCRHCGCPQIENCRKLDIHHIDYNKFNNTFNNLLALCTPCHTATSIKRKSWKQHFYNLITV